MKTATRDLHIEAGTTYRRTLRFFTDQERETPLNLTGYQFSAWIIRGEDKIEFSITITDAANGVALMELEPSQTIDERPGVFAWDMLVDLPNGDVKKYFKGQVTIHRTGTRLPSE
jgi:hypothetical protein